MKIHVVGIRRAQNELIASFLRDNLSLPCVWTGTAAQAEGQLQSGGFYLHDCSCKDIEGIDGDAIHLLARLPETVLLAFFNVPHIENLEKKLIVMGVRGVFFESDEPDILLRGVRAMLDGEVWASRKTLSECLGRAIPRSATPEDSADCVLSPREKEILLLIANGKKDAAIAEDLCISAHTVKTHLYRAYKKIQVSNRLQAALWAAKNI